MPSILDDHLGQMRCYVLPFEGLSEDMEAALFRGLGLSALDARACERHCARYSVEDVADFVEELENAQAAVATARALGTPIMVDWRGRLCYDVPAAPDHDTQDEDVQEEDRCPWRNDAWLATMVDGTTAG